MADILYSQLSQLNSNRIGTIIITATLRG